MATMDLAREFKAVRGVGTPIVAIKTQNQPDTMRALGSSVGSAGKPWLVWDAVRGLSGQNKEGQAALAAALNGEPQELTIDPVAALAVAAKLPQASALFLVNAHRFTDDPRVATAIGNLREPYKAIGATCILLGPSFRLPAELVPDVILLEDPLPDDPQLKTIVEFVYQQAGEGAGSADAVAELTAEKSEAAVSALRGLSGFGAEQQAFLSLRRNGGGKLNLDMPSLWARKIEAINAIPGLSMEFGKTNPGGISGLKALRGMLDSLFSQSNPERPGACLHIDEIDKALAGFGRQGAGDSSGVTQDQVGQILQYMEDRGWDGVIPVGPPGTGKSLVSKSAAGLYGVPYVRLDLGGLKGSFVGESEQRIRGALEVVDRLAGGRVFVFATCNRLEALPPELRRRFTAGIWYFDLPGLMDRRELWTLYLTKYGLTVQASKLPEVYAWSEGWTGAEIRNVCRAAWRLNISIDEARKLIVPVAESGKEDIDRLRSLAVGRFLDAARGGKYQGPELADQAGPRRRVEVS